ncbi:MAG: cadherin-like domain-containing protein, partial [Prochlorococcaceae cyanobacterium]
MLLPIERIRTVLGLPAVNLASYDAYGVLQLQPADPLAVRMEQVAVQTAILTSLSDDDQGLKLTQAILDTPAGTTLDLADPADLALILGLDTGTFDLTKTTTYPQPLREIHDRNDSMAAAIVDATESGSTSILPLIQKEWDDFASIQDGFAAADKPIASLSVAVNGAPFGTPTSQLPSIASGSFLTFSSSDLLAGFSDPNPGDTLTITDLAATPAGSLELLADSNGVSSWCFTPPEGYTGPVELTYSVVDGAGAAVAASLLVGVVALVDHPASGSLQLDGAAEEGGSLTAVFADLIDPDGPIAAIAWQWQVLDGGSWSALDGQTSDSLLLPDDQSLVDRQVRLEATSTDALGGQTGFVSAGLTVANVDDAASGSLSVAGVSQEGASLSASLVNLLDADGPASVGWRWQELVAGAWVDLAGAGVAMLAIPTGAGWAGRQLRVLATSTDSRGGSTSFIGDPLNVLPAADTTPPSLTAVGLQGLVLSLSFSEALSASGLPSKTGFTVQTVSATGAVTARSVSSVALDPADPSGRRLLLTLSGTAPASSVNVRVSYSDPAGDQGTGVLQDLAGNDAAGFSNRYATSLRSSASVSSLASQFTDLVLTGTGAISGSGNAAANTISGNGAANTITGAAGADTLTGGGGNDRFRLTALNQSPLAGMDRLTDFTIGSDSLDGPSAVAAANLRDGLGPVSALSAAGLPAVLTASTFVKNGAATFTYNDPGLGSTRTFLALNDATAGFSASGDAVIEITGYAG